MVLLCCGGLWGVCAGQSQWFTTFAWGCVDYSIVAASLFVGLWWFTAWVAGFVVWLLGCVLFCNLIVCLFGFYASCFCF